MDYRFGNLPFEDVYRFLVETDNEFPAPLSKKVNLTDYALKLAHFSEFSFCIEDHSIAGMISCYMNRPPIAFISNVCIRSNYQNMGVFKRLFSNLTTHLKSKGFSIVHLEVSDANIIAQKAYLSVGFQAKERASNTSHYFEFLVK